MIVANRSVGIRRYLNKKYRQIPTDRITDVSDDMTLFAETEALLLGIPIASSSDNNLCLLLRMMLLFGADVAFIEGASLSINRG